MKIDFDFIDRLIEVVKNAFEHFKAIDRKIDLGDFSFKETIIRKIKEEVEDDIKLEFNKYLSFL